MHHRISARLLAPSIVGTGIAVAVCAATLHSGPFGDAIYELDGIVDGDQYGVGASSIGDIDGDGVAEFAIGANQDPLALPGRVDVFYGATGLLAASIVGPGTDGRFGFAIDGAGDLDGDTVPDFLVGAPEISLSSSKSGAIYVYSGATFTPIYAPLEAGGVTNDRFGETVRSIRDVDGDGVRDIAGWGPGVGGVHLFSGGTGTPIGRLSLPGTSRFGVAIVELDDVTGDGLPELAVSDHEPGSGPGKVYVFSGTAAVLSVVAGEVQMTLLATIPGEASGDRFGISMDTVPDLDGDGKRDLVVGAREHAGTGAVYVVSTASWSFFRKHVGPASGADYAESVSGFGDFDADGFGDYGVGAARADTGSLTNNGTVTVFSGATGAVIATFEGDQSGAMLGRPVGLGNLNGDGGTEVLVAAIFRDTVDHVNAGTVFVYPGAVIFEVTIDIKPGSFPNSINVGASGTVPIAIFSSALFDAARIDPATVTLAGSMVRLKGKGTPQASFEDVDGDGLLDMVVHVETSAFDLTEGDTEAELTALLLDGTPIVGWDTVRIIE